MCLFADIGYIAQILSQRQDKFAKLADLYTASPDQVLPIISQGV